MDSGPHPLTCPNHAPSPGTGEPRNRANRRSDYPTPAVITTLRIHHLNRADLVLAQDAARELLALGEDTRDTGYLVEGCRAIGLVSFYAGEFNGARSHLERGIALYDPQVHGGHALRYSEDPGEVCLSFVARALWVLGYPDQAVRSSEQAIAVARATSHAASIAEAMIRRGEIALFRREVQDARKRAVATLALATECGLGVPDWHGYHHARVGAVGAGPKRRGGRANPTVSAPDCMI